MIYLVNYNHRSKQFEVDEKPIMTWQLAKLPKEKYFVSYTDAEQHAFHLNKNSVPLSKLRKGYTDNNIDAISVLKCKECEKPWVLTLQECMWYSDKGYSLPQRCPACREKRKILNNT